MPIIQGKILEGSTIHTDGWKAYDGLILNGYDHYRVYHSHDEFVRGKCHVNGIDRSLRRRASRKTRDEPKAEACPSQNFGVSQKDALRNSTDFLTKHSICTAKNVTGACDADDRQIAQRVSVAHQFRFNHRNQNLYAIMVQELRKNPL